MLDTPTVGEEEPDAGERALVDGEQMHRQCLQAVGRNQLDVVVQEEKQVAVAALPRDDLVVDPW